MFNFFKYNLNYFIISQKLPSVLDICLTMKQWPLFNIIIHGQYDLMIHKEYPQKVFFL